MAIIEFKNVSRRYGSVYALKAFDYRFRESEITAVVGRSGSGKSTLLQLINGLIRPSDGQVSVFGQPIDDDRLMDLRQRIGDVEQGVGLPLKNTRLILHSTIPAALLAIAVELIFEFIERFLIPAHLRQHPSP